MSKEERTDTMATDPMLLPALAEPEDVPFRDDPPYRTFLELMFLENTVLLLFADVAADPALCRRLHAIGHYQSMLLCARWLDHSRAKTKAEKDRDGVIHPGASAYSVYRKRAYVEAGAWALVQLLLTDPQLRRLLDADERLRLVQRVGHLRNALTIARREASGEYARALADIQELPDGISPWQA